MIYSPSLKRQVTNTTSLPECQEHIQECNAWMIECGHYIYAGY